MHEDGTEHFLGEREAAEYLGVAESVLRKWCEAGLVRCTTVTEGGDEYQVKDLDRALASAFSATFPPLPNDAFVGRSRLIAQARKQLAGNQLLTITGPPGVGKTRVAFELCRLVSRPRVYVNAFAVETLEVLLRRVAAALDFGQKDAPTQADLSRVLADQGALLLVDDADELDAKAAACLARWARSTGRESVVATSRTPLRVTGEVTLPLPPLATEQGGYGEPAAASLLRCRAQQHDATLRFDRDDLVRIAARLDGLPLALELAAPILARLGPRALLTPVQTLQVLKQTGRDAPDHHASMSLCIYWSWRSLDEDAQQALTRLSVFRGPFDHDMALVVLDSLVADELIGELAARSLLQVIRPGEWRVLRVVGEFACQRDPPEFERARHAHAEAMGQFAAGCVRRARSVSGNSTGREVHTYQANLLHAFDFSMTHQRAELAHTLGACLCLVQVGAAAALETTRPALDLNAPSPEWKVRLATARLNLRGRLGSLDLARTELERVQNSVDLRQHPQLKLELDVATFWTSILIRPTNTTSVDEADLVQRARAAGDLASLGEVLWVQALRRKSEGGGPDEVLGLAREAVEALEASGNLLQRSVALVNMSRLYVELQSSADAQRLLRLASQACQDNDLPALQAFHIETSAIYHFDRGEIDRTKTLLQDAAKRWQEMDALYRRTRVMLSLAVIEAGAGDLDAARQACDQALRDAISAGDADFEDHVRLLLAYIEASAHDTASARSLFERSKEPPPHTAANVKDFDAVLRAAVAARLSPNAANVEALERVMLQTAATAKRSFPYRLMQVMLRRYRVPASAGKWLTVGADGGWFQLGEDDVVQVKGAQMRVLRALVHKRQQPDGTAASVEELIELGWPGERMLTSSAVHRVRVAIWTLRQQGLRGILETVPGGYRLSHAHPLWVPHPSTDGLNSFEVR